MSFIDKCEAAMVNSISRIAGSDEKITYYRNWNPSEFPAKSVIIMERTYEVQDFSGMAVPSHMTDFDVPAKTMKDMLGEVWKPQSGDFIVRSDSRRYDLLLNVNAAYQILGSYIRLHTTFYGEFNADTDLPDCGYEKVEDILDAIIDG